MATSLIFTSCGTGNYDVGKASGDASDKSAGELLDAVVSAQYPEMAAYPDETLFYDEDGNYDGEAEYEAYELWNKDRDSQREQSSVYTDELDSYLLKSIPRYLAEHDGENIVCSPINIYMALGMLAEITDGETREQILSLTGSESIEDLRKISSAIWNANYCDDGAFESILASSIWLRDDTTYSTDTLQNLADYYYASSFAGEMGSDVFNNTLHDWINTQTGDLLKDKASALSFDNDTLLGLVTTVYFRAKWEESFSEDMTQNGIFHAKTEDIECDFMNQTIETLYYTGNGYTAVGKTLDNRAGTMYFILPDEGKTPEELILDSDELKEILNGSYPESINAEVNLSLPKFDVSSDIDLTDALKALGVTDVFDGNNSDFSPLTSDDGIFVSSARHAARCAVDEEGVTAAAYTVMLLEGCAAQDYEPVDFILDRPFLFVITGYDNLPIFVGVVNHV